MEGERLRRPNDDRLKCEEDRQNDSMHRKSIYLNFFRSVQRGSQKTAWRLDAKHNIAGKLSANKRDDGPRLFLQWLAMFQALRVALAGSNDGHQSHAKQTLAKVVYCAPSDESRLCIKSIWLMVQVPRASALMVGSA